MSKTVYLHTIDGEPGAFDGYQVCFISRSGGSAWAKPCGSLKQIRKEQAKSRANRKRDGFPNDAEYGYVKLSV